MDPEKQRLRTMLCLAALTYRRYTSWSPGTLHDQRLRSAVENGLEEIADLRGRWDLAWGPESYRAPFSLFDDAMMFVVRERKAPHRYVIAVRGTNPVSAFDWVLGDLWVARPVPWPYGPKDAAAVSMSTALGLIILQNMRAHGPDAPGGDLAALWKRVDAIATKTGTIGTLAGQAVATILETIGSGLRDALADVTPPPLPELPDDAAMIRCIDRARGSVGKVFAEFDDSVSKLRAVGDFAHLGLFKLLGTAVRVRAAKAGGHDLPTFLRGVVETEGAVEITVTGHSKGGALAPALALWLAETQGAANDADVRWDPKKDAKVHCVAFAGPSPGNGEFARRFNRAFTDRFDRVVNDKDIVPCAWEPSTLGQIKSLYVPAPACPAELAILIESIAQRVEGLGYKHLGGRLKTLRPAIDAGAKSFAAQLIQQHLDGYFEALDLPLETAVLFNPIA